MSQSEQAWGPWPTGRDDAPPAAPGGADKPVGAGPGPATVGEILQGAIKTVLSGPRVLVGGALLIVGTVQALVLVAVWLLVGGLDLGQPPTAAQGVRLTAAAAVSMLGSWTVSVAMTGLGASAASEWVDARPITYATVVPRVWSRSGTLAVAIAVAVGIPLVSGMAVATAAVVLALVVGGGGGLGLGAAGVVIGLGLGFFLAIRLVLSPVAAVLTDGSASKAVSESWSLTRRHFWRVLGFIILNVLLAQTVNAVVAGPLGVIVSENPEALSGAALLGAAVTNAVAVTLTAPFTSCVTALLFLDLRGRDSSAPGAADSADQ